MRLSPNALTPALSRLLILWQNFLCILDSLHTSFCFLQLYKHPPYSFLPPWSRKMRYQDLHYIRARHCWASNPEPPRSLMHYKDFWHQGAEWLETIGTTSADCSIAVLPNFIDPFHKCRWSQPASRIAYGAGCLIHGGRDFQIATDLTATARSGFIITASHCLLMTALT